MRAQKDASNAYNTYYYTQTIQISTITSSNYSPRSIPPNARISPSKKKKKKKTKEKCFQKNNSKTRLRTASTPSITSANI